jgi:predicted small secreted protein
MRTMTQIPRIFALSLLLAFALPACTTARYAAEDSTDLAAHAVTKTGHAIAHGGEKIADHM